jgi:hypothetical protein
MMEIFLILFAILIKKALEDSFHLLLSLEPVSNGKK